MKPTSSTIIIYSLEITDNVIAMTTISISDDLRRQLLKFAAELQARKGEKVDYDQVVSYLLARASRDPQLFKKACAPVAVDMSEIRHELQRGRTEDQRRERELEAKYR
jgi:hypothetical protein